MAKVIWKYPLQVQDSQVVSLPVGAKILDIQVQHGQPQLWALVDPSQDVAPRTILIYGTGHPIGRDPGRYIATFQLFAGGLVFHAFEA